MSDPYCVVKVDNEVVARTATVFRNLEPFWGEEYCLHMPSSFQDVSVYIYDQDKVSGDDIIGKVSIPRVTLYGNPKGLESWFRLEKVTKDSEVQGQIYLEYGTLISPETCDPKVFINVVEGRDLAIKDKSGSSDPYVTVVCFNEEQSTNKQKKTRFPVWNETFRFNKPTPVPEGETIRVTVMDWDRIGDNDFMGQVEIIVADICNADQTIRKWHTLKRKQETSNKHDNQTKDHGSLRLRLRLMEERVLPSTYYQPLIELFIQSVQDPEKYRCRTPLRMLEDVMTLDLLEIASTLVKLYLCHGAIVNYLDIICYEEIQNTGDPNTLFRGNSLATKSMDQFMKIVGMPYLHETLGPVIEKVYSEKKAVELDPSRLLNMRRKSRTQDNSADVIKQSREILMNYMRQIMNGIIDSYTRCPPVMRLVFRNLRKRVSEKWPKEEDEAHLYLAVSGFLFLRFFAAAIMSPRLFSLQEQHPGQKVSRTLTLLAKITQSIGNLGLQLVKEQWLEPMNNFIKDNISGLKSYINVLVDIDNSSAISGDKHGYRSPLHRNVTLKEGYLQKCRFHKRKFLKPFVLKQRYFWLTCNSLHYAKSPDDQVWTTVMTDQIYAVERVDYVAFGKSNIGQIITKNEDNSLSCLYFNAKHVNDLYSWMSAIRKVCVLHGNKISFYHPGIYKGHKWMCCQKTEMTAGGCNKSHPCVTMGDWQDPLNPDLEAQVIYSQLHHGRDMLKQKYQETQSSVAEEIAIHQSNEDPECDNQSEIGAAEDEQLGSVAAILDVISDLDKSHQAFVRREKHEEEHNPHKDDIS
ncbi:hypothetical protein ScPMuIL_006039 [Solemya velum]